MFCLDGPAWFYRLLTFPFFLVLLFGLGLGSLFTVSFIAIGIRKGDSRRRRDERLANL